MAQRYLAAIGGNLPVGSMQPLDVVTAGLAAIAAAGVTAIRCSALYRTPAFPPGAGPDFVNGALSFQSSLWPAQVLNIFHEIETSFARTRHHRWAGRTLDLDLVAAGNAVLPDATTWRHWHDLTPAAQRTETPGELILPHPRLQDRAFVLVPLMDVAPEWRHPVLGRTIAEMCAEIPAADRDSVVKLADPPCV